VNDSGVKTRLMNLINKMTEEQQAELLNLLEWKPEEQRKYPRKPYFREVDYATNNQVFRDFIQNLSAGGMFIETRELFCVGQEITLVFSLPDCGKPVKIRGEIVRHGPQGIGVAFKQEIQYPKKKNITAYVKG
jgi:Tfp pilus assembly protein PilZ